MDKNTIWASVLSVAVIGTFIFLQPVFRPAEKNVQMQSSVAPVAEAPVENDSIVKNSSEKKPVLTQAADTDESVPEQTVTIKTDKISAVLTNKGGDIVDYELLNHIDTDTGNGVQMADSISDFNRSCAVSFGGPDNMLLNDKFNVERPDENTVLFTKHYNGYTLGKRYTFKPGEYIFKLEIMIHSDDGNVVLNNNGTAYTLRTSPQIGPHFDSKANRYEVRQFLSFSGEKKKTISVGSKQFKSFDKSYTWAGIAGKYFEALVIPVNAADMGDAYYSSKSEVNDYADAQAYLTRRQFSGSDLSDTYYIYFGPRNEKDLRRYNVPENNGWQLSGLKLSESLQSSGWLGWLENILKWMLEILYKLIPNWGVSIILLTVFFKFAMFPLTKKQSLSTLKMQNLQPQMTAIQAKYKDNPQKLQEAMGKLYKENDYNPAGGCLPMLLQFLILFAMYNLFNNYFEFRGASFIPGWIPDLSAGDSVYTFKKSIPFFGNAIRILPVIYLGSQLLYGKITQNGGTAVGNGTSAAQMKFMMYGMPIVFFFIFYNAPSGLLLYWTVSNLIQMGQQLVINKIMEEKKKESAIEKNAKSFTVAKNKKR
ncbi:MAG: membrane protein insertase YidC [Treponema sp.]|nr:membrane protein insertase YidC [Treponema sp.]